MKKAFYVCIVMLMAQVLHAQTDTSKATTRVDTSSMNADELYNIAREKAFNGEREEARRLCKLALNKNPNYLEIAVFIGRTYAWDGKKAEARMAYKEVLDREPSNIEATLALADLELWDEKPLEALAHLDKSLEVFPNNYDLLFKKAKALVSAKRDEEALLILSRAIELRPGSKEAIELRRNIKGRRFKHTVMVNIAGDFYSDDNYKPMYYSFLQFGTTTKMGALIGRVNYAYRFGENGVQPEVDFYPSLWKGAYGYFNYGFTTSPLFPKHRVGGEIFQSLPKSFEASVGLRYMNFTPTIDVTIYTASAGWYYKSYWFNARTYITPDVGTFSRSLSLIARKYFSDANNYIGIGVGGGFSPDARRIQTNVGLDAGNNIYFLKSQKVAVAFQKSIRYDMLLSTEIYYSNQELSYGNYVKVGGFTTGLKIRL
jgi:YaiO family outer membrane protein